jgi:hypothetical protein
MANLHQASSPTGQIQPHCNRGPNNDPVFTGYDPWRDLADNHPHIRVVLVPMRGDLLGELREAGLVIALRSGTTAAQRRCTLTHELVHLERGIRECGPWQQREELAVHREAARRLIPMGALLRGVTVAAHSSGTGLLADELGVDSDTLDVRLASLNRSERRALSGRWRGVRADI